MGMVLCRGHWSLWSLPAQLILCFCAKRTFSVSNFKQTVQLKYLSYYNNNKPHLSSLPILQANKTVAALYLSSLKPAAVQLPVLHTEKEALL